MAKYKLDVARDVDADDDGYILNLPNGFKIFDDDCHTIGFDTMKELRQYARTMVVECTCPDCLKSVKKAA